MDGYLVENRQNHEELHLTRTPDRLILEYFSPHQESNKTLQLLTFGIRSFNV